MNVKYIICVSILIQCRLSEAGFWDWAFTGSYKDKEISKVDHSMGSNLGKLVSVPFEMRTSDEKFIVEAAKYGLQASDLDICHHKVMMHLKKSCGSLTEEDVGKLSVHLLNCQSSVENRRTYKCDETMTISECTKDMDPNTWNAYHIVGNRARAVCYASRQQQFTAKAEMTVNKLVWTSEHQIVALQKLEEGQNKVGEITQKTLDSMVVGQKELGERQERLKASQQHIQTFVHGNLRELTREKALIAAGQKELAMMTESILNKLDEASKKMVNNEDIRKSNHQEILQDLSNVQLKAMEMWEKIDNSTQYILKQHSNALLHYQSTLDNLERINHTVSYLLKLVNKTRIEIDDKLGWVTKLLFDAGDQLTVIYGCVIHSVYFLVSLITASFLNAPNISRICILILIPLNALSEIKHQPCLNFASLTILLVSTLAAHWIISSAKRALIAPPQLLNMCYKIQNTVCKGLSKTKSSTKKISRENSRTDFEFTNRNINSTHINGQLEYDALETTENSISFIATEDIVQTPSSTSTPKQSFASSFNSEMCSPTLDLLGELDNGKINGIARSRRLSHSSVSSKKSCSGLNKSGLPCKMSVASEKDYCHRHVDQQTT